MNARDVEKELKRFANPRRAKNLAWFFKTAPGGYGEGDKFLGLMVPESRAVAKHFRDLPLMEIERLLESSWHESRFAALEILVMQYEKTEKMPAEGEKKKIQKRITDFYLAHTPAINSWDLVDTSAPYILGNYLLTRNRKILYRLAKSKSLWDRRIAIVSTQTLIQTGHFEDTLMLSKILLHDKHDLIHKAVGWMLREVGNRSKPELVSFLDAYASEMSRTMLRYAIEKFPAEERAEYLSLKKIR